MTDKKTAAAKKAATKPQVDPIEKARQKEQERAQVVGSPTVPAPDEHDDSNTVPPGTVGV